MMHCARCVEACKCKLVSTSVPPPKCDPPEAVPSWLAHLKAGGVLAGTLGPGRLRFVTHLDVDDAGIERAIEAFHTVLGAPERSAATPGAAAMLSCDAVVVTVVSATAGRAATASAQSRARVVRRRRMRGAGEVGRRQPDRGSGEADRRDAPHPFGRRPPDRVDSRGRSRDRVSARTDGARRARA